MESSWNQIPCAWIARASRSGSAAAATSAESSRRAKERSVAVRHSPYNRPVVDPRPIGVFDSGMGGLTVLHECLVTMPHEDFVYLGDGARLPYGPRRPDELRRFAREIAT